MTNLFLNAQSDDGFIAWINGVEVLRYNMAAGELPYNGSRSSTSPSRNNSGAAYILYTLPRRAALPGTGTNVLAVQAFNNKPATSSDFGFNAQLYTYLADPPPSRPACSQVDPRQGDVFYLTNITVTFSEGVTNVDPGDLRVNGVPAEAVVSTHSSEHTFSFAQPAYGPVVITWATNHGMVDFDDVPKPFNGNAASSILHYTLINPGNPRVAFQVPLADTVVTGLTAIAVTFTEPVTGVDATDLLVTGVPAFEVSPTDDTHFLFTFPQPAYGTVTIRWATNHGITDQEALPNSFDPTRFGGQWNYTLVDPVPSVAITSPANGAYVLEPATVTLSASASDNDGAVERVEFFEGARRLGEVSTTPFSLTVSNLPVSVYTFRAVATDNTGLMGTSAPVVLNVVTSLPAALLRGPYLQIGTSTSGVVRWRTDLLTQGTVRYGTDPANLTGEAAETASVTNHIVQISGLEPDTKYYYSVYSGGRNLAGGTDYWFKTSPLPGTRRPVRFWALGDSGTAGYGITGSNNAINVREAFYRLAATNGPADLWFMLGDNAYDRGTDHEHQIGLFDMYPITLRNLFLWPTIGNHETAQATTIADFPYLQIFSLPQNGEAGGVPSGTPRYYSFDYANVHFVCLDSMTSGRTTNTAMGQWLVNDLAATTQDWIIVFFHHPPYTKGNHDSDRETELIQIRQNFNPIFEAHGVDLVICGHSHNLERSYLLNGHYGLSTTLTDSMKINAGDGREDGAGAYKKNDQGQGVVYMVAGSSGQITGGSLNHPAHFISLNQLGSAVLEVDGGRMEVKFLGTNGTFLDHYTVVKDLPAAPSAPVNLVATALSADRIALSWTDTSTNEADVTIERSTDGTNFVVVLRADPNATEALDTGLAAITTYFYRVRASNASGASDYSNIASATTVPPTGVPLAPSDLIASADQGAEFYRSQILLRWRDRSANEAGFVIERTVDGETFSPIGTVGANVTLYVDHNLASATSYFYRVRSYNASGTSLPSNLAGDETHPQSEVVLVGQSATFHAGVEGAPPIRYQWRFMGIALFGETNQTLTIPNVQVSDEGAYTVVITDAGGRTTSNPAWLFVVAPPVIVEQPVSRTNVVGSAASFRVTADDVFPLFYQWRKDGVSLPGAEAEEFVLTSVTLADQGHYDVVVMNDFGAATSQLARLVVNIPPVAGSDRLYRYEDEGVAVDVADLLANDIDPDGDSIMLMGVSPSSEQGGTVQRTGRYVIYAPPAGYSADDAFTYTLADSRGAAAVGVVTVSVTDNRPPQLVPVPDLVAAVMTPLVYTNVATDPNQPTNRLTYSLEAGAPANASVNPTNGIFRWTPTRDQGPGTNVITVLVTDDGRPALSDAQAFRVAVLDYVEMSLGSVTLLAGERGSVPIDCFSSVGLRTLTCTVRFPLDRLTDLTVEDLAPSVASVTTNLTAGDGVRLTFATHPGQTVVGTLQLARLHFTGSAGQTSAFVPLELRDLVVFRAQAGFPPSTMLHDGRVTVVANQPLLEARVDEPTGVRTLTLYGHPGATYTLEASQHPAYSASWQAWRSITLTTYSESVDVSQGAGAPAVFYRARE